MPPVTQAVRNQSMKLISIIFLCGLILYGCCNNVAVVQHEGLSRTYINLKFEKSSGAYESIREVGGEHADVYYFMLPKDCVYELSISSIKGNASAYLEFNDEILWSTSENTSVEQRHRIIGQEFWRLTLSVMAHPVDTYTLRIFKTRNCS
jgi:hypothetical protein